MDKKKLTHYGVDVTVVDNDFCGMFKKSLKDSDISFTNLILKEDVITYKVDGVRKYACITERDTIKHPCSERIYITDEIPIDFDFEFLVRDIENQLNYDLEPFACKSMAERVIRRLIDLAEKTETYKKRYCKALKTGEERLLDMLADESVVKIKNIDLHMALSQTEYTYYDLQKLVERNPESRNVLPESCRDFV